MAPTAQAPLPAFGSSVAFIGAFVTVPLESRLCWDDNRFDDVTIHADRPVDAECNRPEAKYDMRINIKESRWRRREFLELGATTTAMAVLGDIGPAGRTGNGMEQGAKPLFRTSLCDLLGIEYPIIQAGMSGVAGPELVAEVSNAGGLGILTGALTPPAELREKVFLEAPPDLSSY